MKFKIIHKFNFPADKIIEMLSNGEDLCPMEALPNVSSREILENRREGNKLYSTAQWSVYGQIPKLAKKILTPEMLTVTEKTIWDDDKAMARIHIVPRHFKDKVTFKMTSAWKADAEGAAIRVIKGEFKVDIPIVGAALEKNVVHQLRQSSDESAVLAKKYLSARWGGNQPRQSAE